MSFKFELCETEFWDVNSTWNTDSPQLSSCFRDTALVWLPACMFLLAIINESFNIRSARFKRSKAIPWNCFNRFRIFITLVAFLLKLSEFFSHVYALKHSSFYEIDVSNSSDNGIIKEDDKVVVVSPLISPAIQLLCYLSLMLIYRLQRQVGIHTSATIWFYLFVSLICGAFDYYSVIQSIRLAIYDDVELWSKLSHYPILILLFILECRGDSTNIETDHTDVRPDSPELTSSFLSSITFWWFNNFLIYGFKYRIKLTNLWKTLNRDRASELVPRFRAAWQKQKRDSPTCSSQRSTYHSSSGNALHTSNIVLVLFKLLWPKLLLAAILKFIQDCLQYLTPMILKQVLQFMKNDEPVWHGAVYTMLLLIVPTIQSTILGNYFYHIQVTGLQAKTMIIGAVYRKALLLSGSSGTESTSGEIVNLMAVDSQRFQDLLFYINLLWSAPFQIILAVFLLYQELGWPIFAGVGCMALVLPANAYIADQIKFAQIKLMKTKDERIKQMNEILSGIKVIKLYAWESSFISNLFGFRVLELKFLRRILNLDSVQVFLWNCSPFLVAVVTFAVFVNLDASNVLDAQKAFVSISLFNLLRFPLTMLPSLVTSVILTLVSARRLNKFLNSNELVRYVTRNEELEAISIEGGTLAWSQGQDADPIKNAVLKDIDLHVKKASFVAIVGQVASGKSSLLASILGELHRISGRFNICKSTSLAYVPQQAWIQNMTVKDNILFGSPYNEERYKQALSVCSLQSDLDALPGGDQAEIGEKGINLSGGQKQRVSLARACYSNSDTYLLDDPLSALDSHVAKHVFDNVLSSTTGLLRNKTRVLATNSLFVLPYVDHIVVLKSGRVVESGTYSDLMNIEKGHLSECMRQYSGTHKDTTEAAAGVDPLTMVVDKPEVVNQKSIGSQAKDGDDSNKTLGAKSDEQLGRLVEIEKVEMGSVHFDVYLKYFKAVSFSWLACVAIAFVASNSFNVATNLWLSVWSSDADDPKRSQDKGLRTLRLSVYALLGGLQCFMILVGSFALSIGSVRACKGLHAGLLNQVMHSPMSFFDTTPIGRIVNRFAKDIDVVDSTIPGTLRAWMSCLLQVLATFFVICYTFPTFTLIILPLGFTYYLIQKVFIVTTRQLKRLESNTRSPIYSHFSETLSGKSTIRAYDCVDDFINYSDNLVDRNQSCSYPNIIANRWLSLRLEFFGNLITTCAALFSVYYRGVVGAGVAGLTISYSLNITQTLSWLVRMTSEIETNIVSVERILEYMRNKLEDVWVKEKRPPLEWPNEGCIEFKDYSSRYREDTDLVLRNVSINIEPREKVGIVGRTGSGKSSLSLSLFRILEPASGQILIDKLDVIEFGLYDIRSKLTIIPQDPVLFSGTLRFNLDPLKLYNDFDIWRALESAHLKPYISSLKLGLDYKVSEYGENFSIGQRQLICLARAILRKSKILVLDEATASVDLETDSIVQKTIREIFTDCTIITIAHRLHTILDSDRILVLDKGSVKELDSPTNLISNPNSVFTSLVRDAGIEVENVLKITNERRKIE